MCFHIRRAKTKSLLVSFAQQSTSADVFNIQFDLKILAEKINDSKSVKTCRPQTRSFIANLFISSVLETEKFVTDVNIRYRAAFGIIVCLGLLMCYHHLLFDYDLLYASVTDKIKEERRCV